MAGFGGAVKLTGEQAYKDALARITQQLKENASAQQLVASQYDKTDKSTEAVTARSKALNDTLATQQERLRILQEQYAGLSSRVQEQADKHKALVSEYENEKRKLSDLEITVGKTSDEYKTQQARVAELAIEVAKSTSNNQKNEQSLSALKTQMNLTQVAINGTADAIEKLDKESEDTGEKAEEASKGYTIFKNVLANLATEVINSAVRALQKLGSTFIDIGRQSIQAYGQMEQLQGGVAKIFGEDMADDVIANAGKAFSTVGISANQYMEQVTGFSSALIQSLKGDTAEAVRTADRIMQDMADNANTYGTDMTSIQYAYQGFAKQNYTMLDNLKLGYGGTKTEMERLIADASKLTDIQEQLGITVEEGSLSFANIANAISVMQNKYGVMGTTANEAKFTLEGSTKAMQASWQNLLTGIADDNADFDGLIQDFINTLVPEDGQGGWVANVVPRVEKIINGIGDTIQKLLPVAIQTIVPIINNNLPRILKAVQEALQAIMDTLPMIFPTINALIPQIVTDLISNLPMVVETGLELILALINGIIEATPQLLNMMPQIVTQLVDAIMSHGQEILEVGVKLIGMLIVGIFQSIHSLAQAGVKVLESLNDAFAPIKDWSYNVGKNLVQGIWNGISGAYTWITNKIRGWVGNVTAFIKRLFGIHSPSTLFRDEIGTNLALGIGEGFSDEMEDVSRMMADSIPTSFDIDSPTVNGSRYSESLDMISAFKEALSQMKIELDDEVAGRFVENTVSRAIYA